MDLLKKSFKKYFESNRKKIVHGEISICIGNEGCDLDSFISSLVVGYAEEVIHVVNMKKEVFICKGELMWVCNKFGIEVDDLIFFERPMGQFSPRARILGSYFLTKDGKYFLESKKITLHLTDHNDPVPEMIFNEIELIIDHHKLEDHIYNVKRIYIDIDVGSATTLVSKYLGKDLSRKHHCVKSTKESLSKAEKKMKETLCSCIAQLLLIPILTDTRFLKRRTSIFDYLEYKKLKKRASISNKELRKNLRGMKKARSNDKEYPTEIILQKDYKNYLFNEMRFGCSTVKYDFEVWIEREGKGSKGVKQDKIGTVLLSQLQSFKEDMGIDFLIVGCKLKKKRHYIILNLPYLTIFSKENLFELVNYKGLSYFRAPVELSRKLLVPRIKAFLNRSKICA
ncbi:exopolyphosphatase PRUNE1-like [Nylanderia fulva]|uniref:exopolyphosphatase PRUNE1-like n=1 Tax=Nylanderia fulva TaxID=613905 RepID=UPI0010FB947B|nr:exopolyphosphatase PRUNE1-like [Nylanderia fulva]